MNTTGRITRTLVALAIIVGLGTVAATAVVANVPQACCVGPRIL
jgi:hypothetical protein